MNAWQQAVCTSHIAEAEETDVKIEVGREAVEVCWQLAASGEKVSCQSPFSIQTNAAQPASILVRLCM